MPNLSALSRGTQILVGAGVLLLIVTFLNWWSVDVGPVSVGENAWNGFWGIVMGLALLVLLAWVIARIFDVRLPIEVPDGLVTLGLGALIFLFAVIKNLDDPESTIWSYLGVVLAAAVAYGAWLRYQEAGGTIETLKTSIPRQESTRATGGTAAPAGTAPMQTEPEPTPTAAPEPASAPSVERTPPSPTTTEPMTQAGPTPPGGVTGPPSPAEPETTTTPPPAAPSAPATPSEPSSPRSADESEAERRPKPPPSSSDQS